MEYRGEPSHPIHHLGSVPGQPHPLLKLAAPGALPGHVLQDLVNLVVAQKSFSVFLHLVSARHLGATVEHVEHITAAEPTVAFGETVQRSHYGVVVARQPIRDVSEELHRLLEQGKLLRGKPTLEALLEDRRSVDRPELRRVEILIVFKRDLAVRPQLGGFLLSSARPRTNQLEELFLGAVRVASEKGVDLLKPLGANSTLQPGGHHPLHSVQELVDEQSVPDVFATLGGGVCHVVPDGVGIQADHMLSRFVIRQRKVLLASHQPSIFN